MDGEIIKKWDNAFEAHKKTGISCQHIYACCKNKFASAGGFFWQYAYLGDTLIINEKMQKVIENNRQVNQYSKSGYFIKKWDNAGIIRKENNIFGSSITACCKHLRPSASGFLWQYSDLGQELIVTPEIERILKKTKLIIK